MCPQYSSPVPVLSSKMGTFSLPQSLNRFYFYIWRRGLGWKYCPYFPRLCYPAVDSLCSLHSRLRLPFAVFTPVFIFFWCSDQKQSMCSSDAWHSEHTGWAIESCSSQRCCRGTILIFWQKLSPQQMGSPQGSVWKWAQYWYHRKSWSSL